ncbi:MAG: SRPBCC domain-containing protein [Planctomycetota bacterium]
MRTVILLLALVASACAGNREARVHEVETHPMISSVSTGEFWYRLQDETGEPQGYAKLVLTTPGGGGLDVAWELKIAWSGGAYEESRALSLDAAGRMTRADYRVAGEVISVATREGDRLRGTAVSSGAQVPVDLKIPDDAITGMLFVLCPGVPFGEGGELSFQELDEANSFVPLGESKLVYGRSEEVDGRAAHRIDIVKAEGGMPVWVSDDGRILKSDWGGGNVMVLSETKTEHLFDPKPAAVLEVPGGPDQLVVEGVFARFTPARMYDHFTKNDLLTKWWSEKATVVPEAGGAYVLEWPNAKWTLRGEVKEAEPGKRLVFTWAWDHMPDSPTRTVTVEFLPEGDGTKLRVTHAAYGEGEAEAKERQGHLMGWTAILSRLRDLK